VQYITHPLARMMASSNSTSALKHPALEIASTLSMLDG
jgi:hypothetical protein